MCGAVTCSKPKLLTIQASIEAFEEMSKANVSPSLKLDNTKVHNSMENTKVQKSAVTLIIGDSISQRLIGDKLGKGTKSIVNLSKGGAKIVHVQKQIQEFHDKFGSSKNVEKLFVCVGTNDIRYCRNGIQHLRSHLKRLSSKIKELYPNATVFLQPVLPQIAMVRATIHNILDYNRTLHELCLSEKFFYLNIFKEFVDNMGFRINGLFEGPTSVHPNPRGMGRIAQHYMSIIHEKRFNPLIY